ncbi:phosphoglycerol geranylgeranyltransferase [Urechidicola croceus]|uniref:Geranylgeranylglyceryl phosphate synthase n=1 Tax=Urechidicola croceus TaxID=1850246 RepID=A0A1D8PBZ3_9FLAO|nr:geranylgeranylglyceryl/heptaprenylglyceryl phosphate synthase [Urechidicola croceus]AOW22112.1 geranylgeranylglyceryl/heptaprenylglyceryl phosphate synthase [Urechidicola croceus]
MKNKILEHIKINKEKGKKLLSILLDPDKLSLDKIQSTIKKINQQKVDFIFVGGSDVKNGITDSFVKKIKEFTEIPVILFPGDFSQLTNNADAVLFLSLLSGRNPEFLIEQQIKSVPFLKESSIEIIPTGYLLIDGGVETSVQKVSETTPISQSSIDLIVDTAVAGEYLGKQIIYLEAGSGAKKIVGKRIIKAVSENLTIPLIVGGGIKTKEQLKQAYQYGADLVVIGTAFEENNNFLKNLE